MPYTPTKPCKTGNITPSPPARPTTPGSQKPAYMAARTPTPARIRGFDDGNSSSMSPSTRQSCRLFRLSLSSASKTAGKAKKRARSSLGNNVESISPTQAIVKRLKRPKISQVLKDEEAMGEGSFAVEIEGENGIDGGSMSLDQTHITSCLEKIAEVPEDTKKATEKMEVTKSPTSPPARRRGRPPKKVSPIQITNETPKRTMDKKPQERATESKPESGTKMSPTSQPPGYGHSKLQELITKLENSEKSAADDAQEIGHLLSEVVENSSVNELAGGMANLKGPLKCAFIEDTATYPLTSPGQ
ncbi:hypothetical protein TWF970_011408 [Orbilia oligospora]|uniref:Uncharacterized protein n=1 Tax=Orbilia oligospora TaxID=2813651 RepID=A0A7C8RH18_ORBOL|nr:hypothetical protein TWF970_011408 [Orbilia oligospora]